MPQNKTQRNHPVKINTNKKKNNFHASENVTEKVKKQSTERDKIFASQISDKCLVSTIYKELLFEHLFSNRVLPGHLFIFFGEISSQAL